MFHYPPTLRKSTTSTILPMCGNDDSTDYNKNRELNFEMQIGSKKYPEYPMQSLAEAFYQLRKSLGLHSVNAQMDISATEYRNNEFVIGADTEKVLGASFSGHNSDASDLTVLRSKPASGGPITTAGTLKLYYVLHYDAVMQIMDSGVQILEYSGKNSKKYMY